LILQILNKEAESLIQHKRGRSPLKKANYNISPQAEGLKQPFIFTNKPGGWPCLRLRQGLERHPGAAAADVFCWPGRADEGSYSAAYKNTAGASRV